MIGPQHQCLVDGGDGTLAPTRAQRRRDLAGDGGRGHHGLESPFALVGTARQGQGARHPPDQSSRPRHDPTRLLGKASRVLGGQQRNHGPQDRERWSARRQQCSQGIALEAEFGRPPRIVGGLTASGHRPIGPQDLGDRFEGVPLRDELGGQPPPVGWTLLAVDGRDAGIEDRFPELKGGGRNGTVSRPGIAPCAQPLEIAPPVEPPSPSVRGHTLDEPAARIGVEGGELHAQELGGLASRYELRADLICSGIGVRHLWPLCSSIRDRGSWIEYSRLIFIDQFNTVAPPCRSRPIADGRIRPPRRRDLEVTVLSVGELAILIGVTVLTAMLSAIVGMAGGIALLGVMLFFYDPLIAIPIHGVVQLVSNGSRTFVQRRHVRWSILGYYSVLALPAGFAGLLVARQIPPDALKAAIGVFVLVATWRPSTLMLGRHPENTDANRRFLVLGGVVGALNILIGATGPLIAPFFLNLGLTRHALIGTKAACQAIGHGFKTLVFAIGGFAYSTYALVIAPMIPAAVLGTWLGSRVLDYVNEVWFTRLYKGVLTLVALRLAFGWLP